MPQSQLRSQLEPERRDAITSPTYFWTSSDPITRMKQASVRLATARAQSVLPVPGGPNRRTPFGGSIPKLTNLSGCARQKEGTS